MNLQHYCTRAQSLRLNELGLKQPKEGGCYESDVLSYLGSDGIERYDLASPYSPESNEVKLWSCAELLDMLPRYVKGIRYDQKERSFDIFIEKLDQNDWLITYDYVNIGGERGLVLHNTANASLAEAAAEMFIYLLENNYMTI